MSDPLLDLVTRGVRVFDLGRPMFAGMPQSPNHPRFLHSVTRRHGDVVRADGGSAANDLLVTGTHVGTHIDALAHVSHQGLLHGGAEANQRHCRACALLWNFAPWGLETTRANRGWRSPAERLNRHRYHESWLHNLLVSASLGGYRNPIPQNP